MWRCLFGIPERIGTDSPSRTRAIARWGAETWKVRSNRVWTTPRLLRKFFASGPMRLTSPSASRGLHDRIWAAGVRKEGSAVSRGALMGGQPLSFCYYGATGINENGQGEGCTKFLLLLLPSCSVVFRHSWNARYWLPLGVRPSRHSSLLAAVIKSFIPFASMHRAAA